MKEKHQKMTDGNRAGPSQQEIQGVTRQRFFFVGTGLSNPFLFQ